MALHRLLERQIKKFISGDLTESSLSQFIAAINESYNSFERDKELSTHSFAISEKEYQQLNENLQAEVNIKKLSIKKLKDSISNIDFENSIKLDLDSDDLLVIVDYLNDQINKRKEVEEKLQDLSLVSEETSNMVIIADAEQRIVWVNKAFVRISGYTLGEVRGKKPGHFLQGESTDQKTIQQIRDTLQAGKSFQGRILNYSKDGTLYWSDLSINPIKDKNGQIVKFISVASDVTDQIRQNEELLKSELKWKIAMEGSGGGVFEYDVEKNRFMASTNLKAMLGLREEQTFITLDQFIAIIIPEGQARVLKAFQALFSNNIATVNQEIGFKKIDGSTISLLVKAIPTKLNKRGMPSYILGTTTDISEIKQTEIELANRVRQFKGLSENIPAAIYEYQFNKDGTEEFKYISPAIEKIFGVSPEDFMVNAIAYIHPDDREIFLKKNAISRDSHTPFVCESRLVIPGKGIYWQYVSSSFTYQTQLGDSVFTGIISDITAEKNAASLLRMNEEKYRGIIDTMKLGLLEMDESNIITYANNAFCTMSNFELSELIGKNLNGLIAPTVNLQGHKPPGSWDAHEIMIKDRHGNSKWWLASKAPRYGSKAMEIGSVGIYLDISDQKDLEISLVKAREEAIRLAKTKETFLANMSHEIRTPLNGIIGMIRELARMGLTSKQELYVQNAGTASQHLLSIVNNILDLSKIEAGVFDLAKEPFSLRQVFDEVKGIVKVSATERGLDLKFDLAEEIAIGFIGDSARIRQILLNIVSNCVKFTEAGFVHVGCVVERASHASQDVAITIKDSGIGMDESFLETIFSKFTQENDSTRRKYSGTGLGMAITHELVQLMQGEIKVTSKKEVGSTFIVRLPLAVDPENKGEAAEVTDYAYHLNGKRVLLVEDNEMNRLVAQNSLGHYKAVTVEAIHGGEALALLATQNFDIILMDLQMPVMDGFEATRLIRKEGVTTPIIALTANAFKSEIDKCMSLGMNDFVTKPFDEEHFLKTIIKNLTNRAGSSVKIAAPISKRSDEKLYDLTRLQSLSRGDKDFINIMIAAFNDQIPDFIKTFNLALKDRDIQLINKTSHKIKPSLFEMGIVCIQEDIEYLESITTYDPQISDRVTKVNDILQKVVFQLAELANYR